MKKNRVLYLRIALIFCVVFFTAIPLQAAENTILKTPDVRKGLCILVEFEDAQQAEELFSDGVKTVHGISSDQNKVDQAREYIQKKGLYGKIAFSVSDMKKLPFADSIGNIVIINSGKEKSLVDEAVRVCAPYGKVFVKGYSGSAKGVEKSKSGSWTVFTKNLPKGVDEWTHYEHDPERTSVSKDTAVELPTGVRWIGGPLYPYEMGSVGFASIAGRNFYSYWAHNAGRYPLTKEESRIECRDSFNGTLLWKKLSSLKIPGASMVAVKDKLYVHLGGPNGFKALDAATGKELFTFQGSNERHGEVLVKDGVLIQCLSKKRFYGNTLGGIQAFNADNGKKLWEKPNYTMVPDMMVAGGDNLYYMFKEARDKPPYLVCCDFKTGKEHWRKEQKMKYKKGGDYTKAPAIISYYREVIFMGTSSRHTFHTDDGSVYGVSAKDGSLMWEYAFTVVGHKATTEDIFPIGDVLWVKTRGQKKASHGLYVALDYLTGKETGKKIDVGYNRCYPDRATTKYLLTGDFDFVDVETEKTHGISAARGFCKSGFMVAQGMTYAFSNRCTCFSLVRGFLGLDVGVQPADTGNPQKFEKPGKGKIIHGTKPQMPNKGEWSTFRMDNTRSNSTDAKIPNNLKKKWSADIGGALTALSAAEGMVFTAATDEHKVIALDADSGSVKWSFTTGGRIDSPPTIYKGLAIFGSADGWVYALGAKDGKLSWKHRAAPRDTMMMARGQLESVWPVPGSVLIENDTLYFAAGRNTHFDGGLFYYAADPVTGKIKWQKQRNESKPGEENSNDVMMRNETDDVIHLGSRVHFNSRDGTNSWWASIKGRRLSAQFGLTVDCLKYFCTTSDIMRTQWGYGKPYYNKVNVKKKYALIAVDKGTVYGVTMHFEFDRKNKKEWMRKPVMSSAPPEKDSKGWSVQIDTNDMMRAMVATADKLVFSVQPLGKKEGELWLVSKTDGKTLATVSVDDTPRWDGLAVVEGKVFVVTDTGKVLCYK